jgi:hypothetical protein
MTTNQIPYVIVEAHPDKKRPYSSTIYGLVDELNLHSTILEHLIDFAYDHIIVEKLKSGEDIEQFWERFYEVNYMDMSPWTATAFINGEWKDMSISNEELFEGLIKRYKEEEKEDEKITVKYDEEDEDEDEDEDEM